MDIFSAINHHKAQNLPFVVFAKPDENKVLAHLQQDDVLYTVEQFTESGFVLASFNQDEVYYIPEEKSDYLEFEISKDLDFLIEPKASGSFKEEDKIQFEQLVASAIATIQSGKCEKIVTSRKEVQAVSGWDWTETFQKMLVLYPKAFRYCFFHPKIGMWMGASPEQLLKVADQRIKTVALAGTRLKATVDKYWGQKEVVEQQLVTEFIQRTLAPFVKELSISEPYTATAGTIQHIKTDIEAELMDENPAGIIKALHPTPAVCGMPKAVALDFLKEHEGYDRRFYAGFIGELNNTQTKQTDLFVNLRCMEVLSEKEVALYIGCGITAESDPEAEFKETVNKAVTMKKIL
ncbi:isochorismate synthase [Flavobacterium sediminis]|uniref:isochorismate synthase n=1 Tax=Flavobacterium sediminis TaxID=2201181 RepID=A0A2U8QQV8_9FLAO|nr:isochorismate synthase [Flavobacterium sediminis]AWM12452.1 isochorismate synthase [Flavobacterium sediminis]